MKFSLALLPLLVALISATGRLPENDLTYLGAQVLRATPTLQSQVRYLNGLMRTSDYSFWTQPRGINNDVDIMAYRWNVPVLKAALERMHISYQVTITDVRKVIAEHKKLNDKAREIAGKAMEWTAYHTYDEIMAWTDSLATTYPNLVTVSNIGLSYEGRVMKMVTVSTGGTGKPAIFVDGGIHAREWVSPSTTTYILNELLSNSAAYADVLAVVDFTFIPIINVDGYDFTWTTNRLWRKTRSPNAGSNCVGTDPNRNFDFHWMESGASQLACAETYAGATPFSEVECRNLRDQILAASQAVVYLTFHSYGQYWLYPWGYAAVDTDDVVELAALAQSSADALEAVYGTVYSVGGSGTILYPAAGASDDYAKGVGNIKYSYTVELRDTGRYGFELPPDQIIPTGIETLAAFENIMYFVRDTYGKK